ncbi:hypothetical protein LINPERPRIM_LOCUS180 [Linum perenne]
MHCWLNKHGEFYKILNYYLPESIKQNITRIRPY